MRWRRRKIRIHVEILFEIQKERDYSEDGDIGGRIILKLILGR
jgi:hypothetical protein